MIENIKTKEKSREEEHDVLDDEFRSLYNDENTGIKDITKEIERDRASEVELALEKIEKERKSKEKSKILKK